MGKQIKNEKMETLVSLCKRRGFIYQGSDVYGGLSGRLDYRPLCEALIRKKKNACLCSLVDERDDRYLLAIHNSEVTRRRLNSYAVLR